MLDDDSITRALPRLAAPRGGAGRHRAGEPRRTPASVQRGLRYLRRRRTGATGVIGAMGPTRMDYARAMSSVRYLAAFLSELVQALEPSPQWQG